LVENWLPLNRSKSCVCSTPSRLFRKLRHRGGCLVDWLFSFGAAAYNLMRWRNLIAQWA
jgi:hypothetical protein